MDAAQEGASLVSSRLVLASSPARLTPSRLEPPTAPLTHIDDEYAQAGIEDPRVLITTSRDPSSKLQQFAKVRSRSSSLPPPAPPR